MSELSLLVGARGGERRAVHAGLSGGAQLSNQDHPRVRRVARHLRNGMRRARGDDTCGSTLRLRARVSHAKEAVRDAARTSA